MIAHLLGRGADKSMRTRLPRAVVTESRSRTGSLREPIGLLDSNMTHMASDDLVDSHIQRLTHAQAAGSKDVQSPQKRALDEDAPTRRCGNLER